MDVALCVHGRCGVAGLAHRRMDKTTSGPEVVFTAMAVECAVDATIFWIASFRTGLRGNHDTLAGIGGNPLVVLASAESRGRFAGALFGLGDLCRGAKLYHLAA